MTLKSIYDDQQEIAWQEQKYEEMAQAIQAYDTIIQEHQFGEDDEQDEAVFSHFDNMMAQLNAEYNGMKGGL